MVLSVEQRDRATQFVELLAACDRQLYGFILSLLADFSDAEEVLQETKVKLWERFDQYDPSRPFDTWARAVAYCQVLTFRKNVSRERLVFSDELLSTLADEYSLQGTAESPRMSALQACLQSLPSKKRDMLAAFYGDRYSMNEIAEKLGMSAAAVQRAISRCRKRLHECISQRLMVQEHTK